MINFRDSISNNNLFSNNPTNTTINNINYNIYNMNQNQNKNLNMNKKDSFLLNKNNQQKTDIKFLNTPKQSGNYKRDSNFSNNLLMNNLNTLNNQQNFNTIGGGNPNQDYNFNQGTYNQGTYFGQQTVTSNCYTHTTKNKIAKFYITDYDILEDLNYSTFGKLYLVKHKFSDKRFIMKKILCGAKDVDSIFSFYNLVYDTRNKHLQEIFAMNIAGIDNFNYSISILSEEVNMDLASHCIFMKTNRKFYPESDLISLLSQCIKGLISLKEKNYCHGNINPNWIFLYDAFNIGEESESKKEEFFDETEREEMRLEKQKLNQIQKKDFLAKLGVPFLKDPLNWPFALQKKVVDTIKKNELFLSPQAYSILSKTTSNQTYDKYKNDIYSLGLTVFYAACLSQKPFFEFKTCYSPEGVKKIVQKYLDLRYSTQFIEILSGMLILNEKSRWNHDRILKVLKFLEK